MKALVPWKEELEKFGNKVKGNTRVFLSDKDLRKKETNLGNFIADGMVQHVSIK